MSPSPPPSVALAPQPATSSAILRPPASAVERRPLARIVMCSSPNPAASSPHGGARREVPPGPCHVAADHNVALRNSSEQFRNRYEASGVGHPSGGPAGHGRVTVRDTRGVGPGPPLVPGDRACQSGRAPAPAQKGSHVRHHLRPGHARLPRRDPPVGRRARPDDRRRRVPGPRRPVGLRQVDRPAHARRPGGGHRRVASASATGTSPTCRRRTATSRWCSRTTRCTRT